MSRPPTHAGDTRLVVLGYHRIADSALDTWSLCVSPRNFAAQLAWLRDHGAVSTLAGAMAGPGLTDPTFVITIDDGYADTAVTAHALLRAHGLPATVFLVSGTLGTSREFWWDAIEVLLLTPGTLPLVFGASWGDRRWSWTFRHDADYATADERRHSGWRAWEPPPTERHAAYQNLWAYLGPLDHDSRTQLLDRLFEAAGRSDRARPSHRIMSCAEANVLASDDRLEIGSHTVTHAMMAALPPEDQYREAFESKQTLERLTSREVSSFAYPFGQPDHYSADTIAAVAAAGYRRACANAPGLANRARSVFEVPRVQVHDWEQPAFAAAVQRWLDSSRHVD